MSDGSSRPALSAHAALNLHLTNRCALSCRHCLYSSGEIPLDEMNTTEVCRIISEHSRLCGGRGTLNLYGGEPLLRSDLHEIVCYARSLDMRVGITTSGIASSSALRLLETAGFERVTIDLHSAQQEPHDWLRARPMHQLGSIGLIRHLLAKNVPVAVNCALNRRNEDQLERVLNLCAELGVIAISFYLMNSIGRGADLSLDTLDGRQWLRSQERTQAWVDRFNPSFAVVWERSYISREESNAGQLRTSLCRRARADSISIRCDGLVFFCCLLSSAAPPLIGVSAKSLGNAKLEPLSEIVARRGNIIYPHSLDGCPALALHLMHTGGRFQDPREEDGDAHLGCPYDWQLINGVQSAMCSVFAPLEP